MMAILGWVLFALTIVVAVWRDVHQQGEAEKRSAEDAKYLLGKQKGWLAEKGNLEVQIARIDKEEGTRKPERIPDSRYRDCIERWPECESGCFDPRCCRWPKSCLCI